MSTITKERAAQIAAGGGYNFDEVEELARIAMASLEAEAVADVVAWSSPNEERTCDIRLRRHDIKAGPLYTAPPVPVSVPDEIESTSCSDFDDYYCEGWNAAIARFKEMNKCL